MFICEFWDVFHNTSFLEHLGETAILCTNCRISTTRYSKKLQTFYARLRYSHSKAFTYLKSQKTVCDGVNLLWSCEMSNCKLMKKKKTLSHIVLHAFCLHFLRIHHNYFFKRGFESLRAQFLFVFFLFNYDSSKSIFFMLNWHLTFFWGFSWV